MQVNQTSRTGNVITFKKPSGGCCDRTYDPQRDNILRMLDLTKFEQPRPSIPGGINMRANIAAMVLLGLLVFLGRECIYKLERSNLCMTKSECIY